MIFIIVRNYKILPIIPPDKAPVEALIYRVKEINELLPWCLSRKQLSDSPEALPAARKLSDFELCTMVLASTMRHVLTQYNVAHGTTFACDLTSFTRLLKRAADQVQTNRDLLNQYKSIASGKGGRVPRKACFAAQGDSEPGQVSRPDGQKKKRV